VLEIKVRDQGMGFKDPSQIGKMFTQLGVVNNVNQNGIGFGLTISKMIVEKLGGQMLIRNHTKFDKMTREPATPAGGRSKPINRLFSCQSSLFSQKYRQNSHQFKQEITEQQVINRETRKPVKAGVRPS
jgi:hypothetical protein